MDSPKPKDKYNAVWLIFFVLGIGTLLPWNFFMTATVYFTSRLEETSIDQLGDVASRSVLEALYNNVMTLCSMIPLLLFTWLNSLLHGFIPQKVRVIGSLTMIFVVFLITAVVVKVEMEPVAFFSLTMVKIFVINSCGAVLQGSLFGMAGRLPISYTTPIMSGQGLAGIFAAFSLICAIATGSDIQDAAFGYFVTACVVILLSILSYLALPKLAFYQYYQDRNNNNRLTTADVERVDDVEMGGEVSPFPEPIVIVIYPKSDPIDVSEDQPEFENVNLEEEYSITIPSEENARAKVSVWAIFKKIWVLALSVCFTFTITIGIFPAVTLDVKSTLADGGQWELYFIPVCCFLVFNIGDWAGRSLTAACMLPRKDSILLPVLVVARLIFVPLFMLTNVQPRHYLPVFFEHDAWFIVFMLLFAFSNGYLASLCMSFGPRKVLRHEAETAGAIMAFFLSLGLALGAALSFLIRVMI